MIKKLKSTLCSLVLLASASLASSCAFEYDAGRVFPREEGSGNEKVIIGYDIQWYLSDVGKKIQTTPVHPDDDGFLTGETTTNLKHGCNQALRLGLSELIFSVPYANVKTELNLRLNASYFSNSGGDRYNNTFYTSKQQASDIRPPEEGSFVFTSVYPYPFTLSPSLNIEILPDNSFKVDLYAGFSYTGFGIRSGHDRFGLWEDVQKDGWSGWGSNYGLKFGVNPFAEDSSAQKKGYITLFIGKEHYDMKFSGEKASIDAYTFLVGLEF